MPSHTHHHGHIHVYLHHHATHMSTCTTVNTAHTTTHHTVHAFFLMHTPTHTHVCIQTTWIPISLPYTTPRIISLPLLSRSAPLHPHIYTYTYRYTYTYTFLTSQKVHTESGQCKCHPVPAVQGQQDAQAKLRFGKR